MAGRGRGRRCGGEAGVGGKAGFLVGRGDEEALRARLRTLLLSPDLRARLGEAGRRRYEEGFTLDGMLARVWAAYEEVLRL